MDEIIRARSLEIVDDDGKVRGRFGLRRSNSDPHLAIFHQDGKVAFELSLETPSRESSEAISSLVNLIPLPNSKSVSNAQHSVPVIRFYDNREKPRLEIRILDESPQYPSIILKDSGGNTRIGITVTPNDDAEMTVIDASGDVGWHELW